MQAVKAEGRAEARIILARVLLTLAFISVLLAGGLFAYLLLTANVSAPTATPTILPKQESRLASNDVVSSEVTAIARQYLSAGLQGHYIHLWSMLSSEKHALWYGEAAFTTFWQHRFQDYHLQRFTLGKVWMLPTWVNPETMTSYSNVLLTYVSLQLEPKMRQMQQQVPPEVLNPTPLFQNLPMVVQHTTGDRWFVLDGGPFDLEAPILPPLKTTIRSVHVPILMYHRIANTPAHDPLSASLQVTPTAFTQQMDYLKAQGYSTITFNQLFDALYYNAPLPTKPIILTFVQQFCYPSGEPFKSGSLKLRQEIVSLLAEDGYIGATTDPGMTGTVQSSSEPFVLLRVRVDGRSTLKVFEESLL